MATIYKIIGEKDGKYVDIYATGEEELNSDKNFDGFIRESIKYCPILTIRRV